jgi:hypothetical protein
MRAPAGLTGNPAVPAETRSDLTADPLQLTPIPAPYLGWGSCYVHHTISEMKERYRIFAESEFDAVNSHARGGWIGEDGEVHEFAAPKNPYRREAS